MIDTAMNFNWNQTPTSNLVQMRGRMYNTRLQRFMSPDPIGYAGGQINLYTYVNNDPMNASDPSGLGAGWSAVGVSSTGSRTGTGWGGNKGVLGGLGGSDGSGGGGGAFGLTSARPAYPGSTLPCRIFTKGWRETAPVSITAVHSTTARSSPDRYRK